MKDTLTLGWKLLLITLVAGALLGITYGITADIIAERELTAADEARKTVLPDAQFTLYEDMQKIQAEGKYPEVQDIYIGKDSAGNVVGYAVSVTAKGFNPDIKLTVGIDVAGTVTGVKINSHSETPGLGARCTEEEYYGQYAGKKADGQIEVIKNAQEEGKITAIAGATITSKGVAKGVNIAAQCVSEYITK